MYRRAASSQSPEFWPQVVEDECPADHAKVRPDDFLLEFVPSPVAGPMRANSATDWPDGLCVEGPILPVGRSSRGDSQHHGAAPGLVHPRGPVRTTHRVRVAKGQVQERLQRTAAVVRVLGSHRPRVGSPLWSMVTRSGCPALQADVFHARERSPESACTGPDSRKG